MLRIKYEDLLNEFKRVLVSRGFTEKNAVDAATVFAQNSLDGIYSHGINRFPRVVEYLDKGEINPDVTATCEMAMGAIERWNGHRGFGPLNAKQAMDRACELAKQYGIGMVALGCGAAATAGRQRIRAALVSAGPTQCPTCRHGAARIARLETIR